MRSPGEPAQGRVRGCPDEVGHDLGDVVLGQRPQGHPDRPGVGQRVPGAAQRHTRCAGAGGREPDDRQPGQADGQAPQRRQRRRVGPLEVVQAHQDRRPHRGPLQLRGQVLEQPVPLLGEVVQRGEARRVQRGPRAVEQGGEHRAHVADLVAHGRSDRPHPHPALPGHGRGLAQQPGLARPGGALDKDRRVPSGGGTVEPGRDHGQLVTASAQPRAPHRPLLDARRGRGAGGRDAGPPWTLPSARGRGQPYLRSPTRGRRERRAPTTVRAHGRRALSDRSG